VFYEKQAREKRKQRRRELESASGSLGDLYRTGTQLSGSSGSFDLESGTESCFDQTGSVKRPSETTDWGLGTSISGTQKREFVSSQMSMWMDSSIPLDALVANQRARVILILLNILGWVTSLLLIE